MKKLCCLLGICLLFVTNVYAGGDPQAGKQKATPCAACHGVDGNSANPAWPKLAGQGEKYLIDQLQLFKEKIRINTLMNPQAVNLSEQDIQDLAAYFAGQSPSTGTADPEKEFQGKKLYVIGERIYHGGNAETGVPACMSCHGPAGVGNVPAKFPRLAGQHSVYTAAQLRAYRSGARYQTDDNLNMMKDISNYMTDTEIDAVAEYISGLY
ncbi:MAG: c-type cytochrome [Gammaproteobacteria bacterium]|nr:c-type cytochrome [Gammaproteobacteria bacterium]